MKKILSVIIFFNLFITSAQKNLFLDNELHELDSTTYKIKCKNEMMRCYQIIKNDTTINVLFNKYKFGKLSKYHNKRIRKEIYKEHQFNGTIFIHYEYNIRNIKETRAWRIKRSKYTNICFLNNETDTTKIALYYSNKSNRVNKCIDKYEKKYNVDILHYYLKGNIAKTDRIEKTKDKNQLIKNYFFKYYHNYQYLLLKPDGQYLLMGTILPPKKLKKLLKNDDWSDYIEDLTKSEKARKAIGFFKMKYTHNCLL